jgi:hypothetical protein
VLERLHVQRRHSYAIGPARVDAVQAANTTIGMRWWSADNTRTMSLSVAITNVQFVLSQVILRDVISTAIISAAAGSDVSVMTTSIHSFSTELDSESGNAATNAQSVLVPVSIKVACANALLTVFREQSQLSHCRTDCLGRIAIGMKHDGTRATVQLKVGNDLIPYAPISTPQELYHNLARSMHEVGDKEYTTMFMKCDDGRYATNLATAMRILCTSTSSPFLQYPMPGCRTSAYPAPQTQRAP